jgi:hypothetical protein
MKNKPFFKSIKMINITLLSFLLFNLFQALYAKRIRIIKLIDSNIYITNKQDTIKLANIEIPSLNSADSLLLVNFFSSFKKHPDDLVLAALGIDCR